MIEQPAIQIESLFDRTSRPISNTRRSRLRTIITFALLVLLVALIGGYLYITDPDRVRDLSQKYLSELTGGPVKVQRASLSIFEGLRLDDIRIEVDDRGQPDSLLLEAKSLHIGYNPAALLFGRIEATRILALEPRVHLVESTDDGIWNFQRLNKRTGTESAVDRPTHLDKLKLPEILLRNARFDYAQIAGGHRTDVGTLIIEGQLVPDENDNYRFRLQSRGGTSGVFPIAEGWLAPGGRQLGVVLRDVEFVDEIKTILPAVVRQFWDEHQLAGRIGETRVSYFKKENGKAGFKVETDLDGVRMSVPAGKWLGDRERERIDRWRNTYTRMASAALGRSPVAKLLINSMQPGTLQLDEVDGTFIFTDEAINIDGLVARVENNRFKLSGALLGYAPNAPFRVRVESLKSENILIPDAPRYMRSMPWPVQEIYYRFKPKGEASFWIELARDASAERPLLTGEVQIHDAAFTFERFPYPIDRANGTLRFGIDPATGMEMLEIVSLTGKGYRGGANENAVVSVTGKVSPLDENAGSDILIRGKDLVSEPLLIESMPPQTRATVLRFDPDKTGKLPIFKGDFECSIHCPTGLSRQWDIVSALDIASATGKLATFPYPLKDLSMRMIVHDQFIDIERSEMRRGDGIVSVTGKIDWSRRIPGTDEPLVQTNLSLTARKMPIDDDLIAALPAAKQKWLRQANLAGIIDIDGKIIPENPDSDESTVDLDVRLSDGSIRLGEGKIELKDLSAAAKIAGSKATLTNANAKRGDATIEAKATLDWTDESDPRITANASVRDLLIDAPLLASLPEKPRAAAKGLKPEGTVDLDIDYADGGYRIAMRPKSLQITPAAFPLTMTQLKGEIVIDRDRVTLNDLTATTADATFFTAGMIDTRTGAVELSVVGRDLKITDTLLDALPEAIRRGIKSTNLQGTVAFDFSKLRIATVDKSKDSVQSVDFAGSLWLADASLQAGVPMTDINGVVNATGQMIGGSIRELSGDVAMESLKLAGRDVTKLTAKLIKPADQDLLQVAKIDGRIADGQIGGQIDSILSAKDPRFGLSLILRNAKVPALTGDLDKPIDGRLTASLSLEGRWDDVATRRGRGDVIVEGKEMYRVPVLFGLMQIANLTLPLDGPIQQAGLRYAVEGNRVTFDAIDLRGKTTSMQGSGWLDFGTKKVQMTLMMGQSAADAVPIFGDLIRSARQDLLQIRVRGSIEEPKVGASAFNTITTTIDEVLKGEK